MTPNPIDPCLPFPWVLLLTQSERTHLHVVRDTPTLERVMRLQDLHKLRLLGVGGPSDPVADIVQRSDAARQVLVAVAERVGLGCRAHLDFSNGAFEIVLDLRQKERLRLKVVCG